MAKFLLLLRSENTEKENRFYIQAIQRFGGEVVFISDTDSYDDVLHALDSVSGVLLPGGYNVGRLDYFLIDYVVSHQLKLLGICQGMQSMALWGSSNQLISIGNSSHHQEEGYVHSVILENSRLQDVLGVHSFYVNSYHYQKVLDSYYFRVVGTSSDGVIEAIEDSNHSFQIGVQWHPERMLEYDEYSKKIFSSFVLN